MANEDAFQQLVRTDPEGQFWNSNNFQNIFGYKRPTGRSEEGYKLLAKIEKETNPEQIKIRKKLEKVENEQNSIKNEIRR